MSESSTSQLEADLGFSLPGDYRQFLVGHKVAHLDETLEYPLAKSAPFGNSGLIDVIHTADGILENSRSGTIGVPERQMMIVGQDLMGLYTYMCFSNDNFGSIFARAPYRSSEFFHVADSWSEFIASCKPATEDGAHELQTDVMPLVSDMHEAIFCKRCIARTSEPDIERIMSLFSDVHEGAHQGECRDCAQQYVIYFLEYRDDLLEYSCLVSHAECESIRTSTDHPKLIRSIVRGRSVFFRAPWIAGWEDGHRVLVEPRPW